MVETIKTGVECLLRIEKGLIFIGTSEAELEDVSWSGLRIDKEGDDIRVIADDGCNKHPFYLPLSEMDICEYFNVEKVTGLQIIQYVKEKSKTIKFEIANAEPKSDKWWGLYSFWDLLQFFADGIFLAEAYHCIRKETEVFERFSKKAMGL